MHYQCNGRIKKINDGVRDIALSEGVERADLVVEKAEVIVVGRMDPEEICCFLHELTQKHVKIETQTAMSEGGTAESQQTKNPVGQVYYHFQPNKSNFHQSTMINHTIDVQSWFL